MKKITLILILIASFATKSFAHCPIPQWCPSAPLHQILCSGEQIEEIEFPSVMGRTLFLEWWSDGTRHISVGTPEGISVSGTTTDFREYGHPVAISGRPVDPGTHHYTVSDVCGRILLNGSITTGDIPKFTIQPDTVGLVTTQDIAFCPDTLSVTLTGSVPITLQWYYTTANDTITGRTEFGASTPLGDPSSAAIPIAVVSPTLPNDEIGIRYYHVTATNICGTVRSDISGMRQVVPPPPTCTPWVGEDGCATEGDGVRVTAPGTITWSGNANIETQTWPISGNGIMQVWSGNVRTSTCNARSTWGTDVTNAMSDCCGPTNGFNGDYFTWCFVMRYAATLCPPPWRVPTCQDFINLDIALGGTGYNRWAGGTGDADPASVPSSDKTIEAQIEWYLGASGDGNAAVNNGGTWGGSRFTAFSNDLTSVGSYYWSSSQFLSFGMRAFFMSLTASNVQPRLNGLRNSGFALRCVRDVP